MTDSKTTDRAIVSVKGGDNISVAMVRDLKGVSQREKAPMGIFITLTEPTKPMKTEAASAGFFETGQGKFPRLQILTVAELLHGTKPKMPIVDPGAVFKIAPKEKGDKSAQGKLL